ncbi:major facilitator superfamily domain-containing protein [Mycena rosella]|uniref:Major facilitator superfamily domain-containing protein n=1 Tax=Mycena rosella TaxID=1033263 RepID=A0AAD7D2X7_MYCRO|nr:major facilitator superfamily domain-containing protein [Mycena rosella]
MASRYISDWTATKRLRAAPFDELGVSSDEDVAAKFLREVDASVASCRCGLYKFSGMVVLRFLLWRFRAPTFVLIIGMYYTKRAQVLRTGVWASANGFGSMVGGIITFGMGHLNTGISGWKWIYVINGLITVLWGVVVFFYLPTSAMDAGSFLTLEERALAIHRIRKNNTGILNRQIKWNQVKEALNPLQDPQGILLFLTIFCNETLIYISQGFINMVSILFGGWLAHRLPNARIYVSIAMLVPTFIGLLLHRRSAHLVLIPCSTLAKFSVFPVYLFPPFATSLFICLSLPGVNVSGYTKRATLSSFAFLGYALGNISGPFMVKVGEVPAYRSVFIVDIICIILQGIFLALLRIYYVRDNARRDKLAAAGEVQNRPEDEFADLTDKQLPGFRYVL